MSLMRYVDEWGQADPPSPALPGHDLPDPWHQNMSMRDNVAVEAIVFDLDGVIIDSEQIWNRVRESLAKERGGRWHDHAHRDMMGMSALSGLGICTMSSDSRTRHRTSRQR